MKTKIRTIRIEQSFLKFESDYVNNEILDTAVFINGALFICISGSNIDDFIKDFNTLSIKYKI